MGRVRRTDILSIRVQSGPGQGSTENNKILQQQCPAYSQLGGVMNQKQLDFENFDDWAELARSDPDAFESRRKAVVDAFIDQAPERHRDRLRRLQWRIDMERERCSNPVSSCIKLYRMMWESFAGDRGLIAALQQAKGLQTHRPARVLPFRERPTS